MILTRGRAWAVAGLGLATVSLVAACTDPDPNYGPPEAIRGRDIDFGDTGAPVPAPAGDGGATPRQLFSQLHTSIMGTCAPCHVPPAGIGNVFFVGTSEDDSYTIFKAKNYQDLTIPPPHGFFTKGAHTGPALTAAQKTLTMTWSAAEIAAGSTGTTDAGVPPSDAGGG